MSDLEMRDYEEEPKKIAHGRFCYCRKCCPNPHGYGFFRRAWRIFKAELKELKRMF